MTVQTSYEDRIEQAFPGLIYDIGNTDIDSFACEEAGGIPFGRGVARGTDGTQQVILGGADIIGFSVRTAKENLYQTTGVLPDYKQNETVGVLRSGYIWVECVTAGGTVGDDWTIAADGRVSVDGTGTAPNNLTGKIERPAVAVTINGVDTFVGLISVGLA